MRRKELEKKGKKKVERCSKICFSIFIHEDTTTFQSKSRRFKESLRVPFSDAGSLCKEQDAVKRYHVLCGNFIMQESNQLPLSDIPGGEYKPLQETAEGWCSNPVSGMTSASSVLLSKQAGNNERTLSFPRSL